MNTGEVLRLKEIVNLVFKGGQGSGNFGHAGRPGEVGGSSSIESIDVPETVYHGTIQFGIDEIQNNGLKPGKRWNGRNGSVYFTTSKEDAISYARQRAAGVDDYPAIVEFELPESFREKVIVDDVDRDYFGYKNSFRIEYKIPPEFIKNIYDESGRVIWSNQKIKEINTKYYSVILIRNRGSE